MGALSGTRNAAEIEINGKTHSLKFENAGGKYALFVDGALHETYRQGGLLTTLLGDLADYPFSIDGEVVIIAMRFGRMRVSVNGAYIDNGAAYSPVKPVPKWSAAFVAAIIIPSFIFGSSILDIFTALCFVYCCTHFILKNPDLKATIQRRILYCFGVTAASWATLGLFWLMENRWK